MGTDLKPIEAWREIDAIALPVVRWIGSDGSRRGGHCVSSNGITIKARDRLRGTIVTLDRNQWEYDTPKDDAGNPK